MTKDEELKKLIEDRYDAEADLEHLYQEMGDLEAADPDYEESDEWNALHHEMNEQENNISYLTACIDSFEDEDE